MSSSYFQTVHLGDLHVNLQRRCILRLLYFNKSDTFSNRIQRNLIKNFFSWFEIYYKKALRVAVWIPDVMQGYHKIDNIDKRNYSVAGREHLFTAVYFVEW